MLRYKADRITVFYMVATTASLLLHWNLPKFNILLFLLQLVMAATVFVIAHNHNHLPTWKSPLLNRLTGYWITFFYGFPNFVWLPTHNLNHHKYNNTAGDDTITYRYSEKNNLVTLLTYPSISGYFQQRPIYKFLFGLRTTKPVEFWYCLSQYFVLAALLAMTFYLNWKKTLLLIIIPQQFCTFSVLILNYLQHVHADEESRYNHSRNFTGKLNKLLLNNGFHTAHHETMGLHWSKLSEAHAKIEMHIDDRLKEKSLFWFLFRVYILGLFMPRFRTRSMRLDRLQAQSVQVDLRQSLS